MYRKRILGVVMAIWKFNRVCLISALCVLLSINGCGKKETSGKKSEEPEYITLSLKDGKKISVDATKFGMKNLPSGDIISYTYGPDTRHIIDDTGAPITQPVYKHELLMETHESIDNLITFFFPSAPYVINRRKLGPLDNYARIVSTKDTIKVRDLNEPYIVIDMRLVYPPVKKPVAAIQPHGELSPIQPVALSSEEDQISALKSRLQMLNDQYGLATVSIPEKRRIRGEIEMLEMELAKLTREVADSKKRAETAVKTEKKDTQANETPVVKIKIVSYNVKKD